MTEEKKDKWLNYLALTTVIFAVFATLATFNGGKFSTRAVLSQNRASSKWSHYQAKSLKGYLYEIQKDKLELELKEKGVELPPKIADDYKKNISYYAAKIAKYEDEKKEIAGEALQLEKLRDDSQVHSRHFGYAIIFLQIAILMSGIAGFIKTKYLWVLGIVLGALGIILFFQSFWLFMEPLFRYLGL